MNIKIPNLFIIYIVLWIYIIHPFRLTWHKNKVNVPHNVYTKIIYLPGATKHKMSKSFRLQPPKKKHHTHTDTPCTNWYPKINQLNNL